MQQSATVLYGYLTLVSLAHVCVVSRTYSLQDRLALLCVHGLLHLLGHDHEVDEEYEEMVAHEEAVLQALALQQQSGT